MWKDKIVEELHKFREAHAAQFNYDVRAIVESLREEGEKSGRQVVSFAKETPAKPIKQVVKELM